MTKDGLVALCTHIWKRQEDHGVADAFRFLGYHDGQEMAAAQYGTRVEEKQAAIKAQKTKRARAAAYQAKASRSKGKQAADDRTVTEGSKSPSIPSAARVTEISATPRDTPGANPNIFPDDCPPTPASPHLPIVEPRPHQLVTPSPRLRSQTSNQSSLLEDCPPTPASLAGQRPIIKPRPQQLATPPRRLRSHRDLDEPTTRSKTRGKQQT
jgi:hypothetical protein